MSKLYQTIPLNESGDPINSIPFDLLHVACAWKFPHYVLKRGQLFLKLYLNRIKLDRFVPFLLDKKLNITLLLDEETYLVLL